MTAIIAGAVGTPGISISTYSTYLIQRYDADGDGLIPVPSVAVDGEPDIVGNPTRMARPGNGDPNLDALVRLADAVGNGDGAASAEELAAVMRRYDQGRDVPGANAYDGILTAQELEWFESDLGDRREQASPGFFVGSKSGSIPELAAALVRAYDREGDGSVDLGSADVTRYELRGGWPSPYYNPAEYSIEGLARFADMHGNRDGAASVAEIEAVLRLYDTGDAYGPPVGGVAGDGALTHDEWIAFELGLGETQLSSASYHSPWDRIHREQLSVPA